MMLIETGFERGAICLVCGLQMQGARTHCTPHDGEKLPAILLFWLKIADDPATKPADRAIANAAYFRWRGGRKGVKR
jgi:hypothetical protein